MFVIFLINCDLAVTQTKITTVQGNNIIGFIVNDSDNEVVLQNLSDIIVTIQTSQIVKKDENVIKLTIKSGVQLEGNIKSIRKYDFDFISTDSVKAVLNFNSVESFNTDDELLNSYLIKKKREGRNTSDSTHIFQKIGIALGTPGLLNVIYEANNQKSCFSFSAGYTGIQLGIGLNAYCLESVELNFMLNFSYLQVNPTGNSKDNEMVLCIGPIADFYLYGLHLQLGLGQHYSSNSMILNLQLGYAYRFGN